MTLGLLLLPGIAGAQKPDIRYVFPAGGRRGTTVEATVTGTAMQRVKEVRLTPNDVTATVTQAKDAKTAVIVLKIAPNAVLGEHELRIIGPGGVSNRFRFFVGSLPEVSKDVTNSDSSHAQVLSSLPVLVNGQILEGVRDYYRFSGKANQTLICAVEGRSILPFIADAVPGWLDACLTLYDAQGKQIASVDDTPTSPDPVLTCKLPADGEYVLEVKDTLDRGRADFIYRLSVGALPRISGIYPLGARRGTTAHVTLMGANLSTQSLTVPVKSDAASALNVSDTNGDLISNSVPFAAGDNPETDEAEPNDSQSAAMRVQVPITINGRIDHPGDEDYFTFQAKARQTLVMEVFARRLGSPVDSVLTLYGPMGAKRAENDDFVDPEQPLLTNHADSRLVFTFPAAGFYTVRIRDAQGNGGPEYAYRLTIAPPHPDFTLIATPDNPNVPRGDSAVLTVTVARKDAYQGEIALSVKNLPPGFTASEAVLAPYQTTTAVTITAPKDTTVTDFSPAIVGTAILGDKTMTRSAVGTEREMQAFSLIHFPRTRDIVCSLAPGGGFSLVEDKPRTGPLEIKQGSSVELTVRAVREPGMRGPITFRIASPVRGIVAPAVTMPADSDTAVIAISVTDEIPTSFRPVLVFAGTLRAGRGATTRLLAAIPVVVKP